MADADRNIVTCMYGIVSIDQKKRLEKCCCSNNGGFLGTLEFGTANNTSCSQWTENSINVTTKFQGIKGCTDTVKGSS